MMNNKGWSMAVVGLALLVAAGCSGSKVASKSSAELPRYQVRTIALVPFTTLTTPQMRDAAGQTFSAPSGAHQFDRGLAGPLQIEQLQSQTAIVPTSAGGTVTQLLWSRLKSRQGVTVLSPGEGAKVLAAQKPQPPAGLAQAVAVAKQLKADAALIGQVMVYQERVGSRFGANPTARVGFEAKLVAADGQVLWEGNYYERQRPMIEDLLGFFERWGMFVTAEELAGYGVDLVLFEFPFGTAGER